MAFETETVLDRRRLRRRLSLWRGAGGDRRRSSPSGSSSSRLPKASASPSAGRSRASASRASSPRTATSCKLLQAARRRQAGRGGDPVHQQPRRHHDRRRSPVRGDPRAVPRRSPWSASSARWRPRPPISSASPPTTSWRAATPSPARSASSSSGPRSRQLLDKLGVKMNEIKSGPLKANPSPFQPLDEAGKAAAEQMVAESQRWFVGLVATRRGIDTAQRRRPRAGPRLLRPRGARLQAGRPDRRRGRGRQMAGGEAQHPQGPQGGRLEAQARKRLGPRRACRSAALGSLFGDRAGGEIADICSTPMTRSADCALTAWYPFGRVRKDEEIQDFGW